MRLTIAAVGRLRAGPERDLTRDYLDRAAATGRALALGPVNLVEIDDRKARDQAAQSARLLEAVPSGATAIALDERGDTMTSPQFARQIARWRDDGRGDLAFVIGGADGLAPDLRNRAEFKLSFGMMVWPHMLARVMLSEQLYRAASILAGSPYHRE